MKILVIIKKGILEELVVQGKEKVEGFLIDYDINPSGKIENLIGEGLVFKSEKDFKKAIKSKL